MKYLFSLVVLVPFTAVAFPTATATGSGIEDGRLSNLLGTSICDEAKDAYEQAREKLKENFSSVRQLVVEGFGRAIVTSETKSLEIANERCSSILERIQEFLDPGEDGEEEA
ncbi:hypothetical protein M3J07_007483 [Ascochyta lentis]